MTKLFTSLFALLVASAATAASAQTPAAASAAPAGAGIQAKVAMCIGCHEIPGYRSSFPEVHHVPMISGQNAGYIAAALTEYKNGERKHPTMRGIAAGLSEQDINQIAAYYAAQTKQELPATPPATQPDAQVAALLQKAACASCHGANFSKPIAPNYPKIAGQYSDYLFVALKAYKTEGNPVVGRGNPIMGAMAKQFSNAELKALAHYIGSLPSELQVEPQSRFRVGAAQ